jgi:hypothetical protein
MKNKIINHIFQYAADDVLLALRHTINQKLDVELKQKSSLPFPKGHDFFQYLKLHEPVIVMVNFTKPQEIMPFIPSSVPFVPIKSL